MGLGLGFGFGRVYPIVARLRPMTGVAFFHDPLVASLQRTVPPLRKNVSS
jgi:hypothetical protein